MDGLQETTATTEVDEVIEGQQEATKTFTQEDVNSLVAKNKAKTADKVRKEIEGSADYQAYLKWQESTKTDTEKQAEQLKKYEEDYKAVIGERDQLQQKLVCMTLGVKADCLDDAITLAKSRMSDEVSFEDAMKSVVEQYKHFTGAVEETKAPTFQTKTTPRSVANNDDTFMAAFKNGRR